MTSLAVTCLALAMFFETRGEPDLSKQYAGHVVMNWSEDSDVTPCDVITNKLHKGHFDYPLGRRPIAAILKDAQKVANRSDIEKAAWERAIEHGKKISRRKADITGGAKFFNVKRKGVRFKTKVKPRVIGNHVYY